MKHMSLWITEFISTGLHNQLFIDISMQKLKALKCKMSSELSPTMQVYYLTKWNPYQNEFQIANIIPKN